MHLSYVLQAAPLLLTLSINSSAAQSQDVPVNCASPAVVQELGELLQLSNPLITPGVMPKLLLTPTSEDTELLAVPNGSQVTKRAKRILLRRSLLTADQEITAAKSAKGVRVFKVRRNKEGRKLFERSRAVAVASCLGPVALGHGIAAGLGLSTADATDTAKQAAAIALAPTAKGTAIVLDLAEQSSKTFVDALLPSQDALTSGGTITSRLMMSNFHLYQAEEISFEEMKARNDALLRSARREGEETVANARLIQNQIDSIASGSILSDSLVNSVCDGVHVITTVGPKLPPVRTITTGGDPIIVSPKCKDLLDPRFLLRTVQDGKLQ